MEPKKISKKSLQRLPVYLNYLRSLPENTVYISATTIAKALGLGEVQVRKDLAIVSHSGRRRTGRSPEQLIRDIEEYLNYVSEIGSIIVGIGKLGQALLDYNGFAQLGLNVLAGFDIQPVQKETEAGKPIFHINHLESFCRSYDVHIGIIAVPAESAQRVCDLLVACGIQAIWNFAPVHLNVPDHVVVQSENLAVSLSALRLRLLNPTAS